MQKLYKEYLSELKTMKLFYGIHQGGNGCAPGKRQTVPHPLGAGFRKDERQYEQQNRQDTQTYPPPVEKLMRNPDEVCA